MKSPTGLHPDPSAATAAKSGQQQPPKVKIFLSLPESKPGSVVKIPNVSHIQVRLLRKAVGETPCHKLGVAISTLQGKSLLGIPFLGMRGLSPNFHIYVSVSDLYIPRIGPHISLYQNRQTDPGNI